MSSFVLFFGCITLPKFKEEPFLDQRRGACSVVLSDQNLCLRMTFEDCLAARGEYAGDGSECQTPTILEPTPLYLDKTVIYSVGGAITAMFAAWAAWARRKRLGVK